jgi:RND family efflux transporter MFP subunit
MSEQNVAVPTRHGSWLRALGLVMLLLLLGAIALGVWRHYARHQEVMATAEAQANFIPEVRVEVVEVRHGPITVTLPGTTLGFIEAAIFARASGYVQKRYVDIGDKVKAGQLLAEISAPEIEDQIIQYESSAKQARAAVEQNKALRSLARVTDRRSVVLTKEGWQSLELNDTDFYNLRAQEQATLAAEFDVASMEAQLRYTNQQKIYQQVLAPFDGVITQRNIDVGSLIQADAPSGTAMFALAHSDVIRVQMYVPQTSAFGVAPGVEAVIRVPEMPDLVLPGKVTRTANALEPTTRTLLTEIDVPNPEGRLKPGVYCMIDLKIPRPAPALVLPASAIIFDENGMQVAVVDKGIAHLHRIAITTDLGTEFEVNEGVEAGDKVIVQPPVNIADGDRVSILSEMPVPKD